MFATVTLKKMTVTQAVGFEKKTIFFEDSYCGDRNDKKLVKSILVVKLPDIKKKTEKRPKECPYCAGKIFRR